MKFIGFIYLVLFSIIANAGNELPHNPQLIDLINTQFMENEKFSEKKISSYRENVQLRRDEIYNATKDYQHKFKGKSEKKSIKKALDKKDLKLYDLILTLSSNLMDLELSEAKVIALRILEIDYALKSEGSNIPLVKAYEFVKNSLHQHTIRKINLLEGEASNLYNNEKNEYYNQQDILRLKETNFDVSKLNPSINSTFWKKRDIKFVDVTRTYQGHNELYNNVVTKFPLKKGVFKEIRKTQSKPKIDFISKINGKKQVFKLKLGAEMHSEITAGALASTLGFHVDISKYVRDFKIILPDNMTIAQLKREWNSYFDAFDFDTYIKEVGKTKKGKIFVIFKEALIETKPEGITRVGPWAWGELGHRGLREARGLLLFNMWISNNDQKEAGNNKIVMKKSHNNQLDFYHYQHDLGFSFGRFFKEKPQDFKWEIVKNINDKQIDISYQNFQENSGFEHVSFSDAKWMVRLIAQLTRSQIEESISLGGWKKEIGMLLTEKLISRRNDLVKAFDLSLEFSDIPFNKLIETENGILKKGNLAVTEFSESTQSYKKEIYEILDPIYEGIESIAVKAALYATSSFDTIVLDGEMLGYKGNGLAEIEVSADREIINNPEQTGVDDNYLVQDTVKVRFALGFGLVTRGKINYVKQYKIVYPVKTEKEARYKNGFIFNALLPRDVRRTDLPDSYVLILEDSLEGEGELLLEVDNIPFSLGMSKSYGNLSRTVISKNIDSFEVYRDASPYIADLKRFYAKLIFMKIPVWEVAEMRGTLTRSVYKVSLKENALKWQDALDELLQKGSMANIIQLAQKKDLISNYVMEKNDTKLLSFFERKDKRRTDDIIEVIHERNKEKTKLSYFQLEIDRSSEWNFIGDGELKKHSLKLLGKTKNNGTLEHPYLDIQFTINDKSTSTEELSGHYFRLVDNLSLQKRFINFTPEIHTHNNLWGNTYTQINLGYNQEALDKIINKSNDDYYELMANTSNRRVSFWKRRSNKNLRPSMREFKRKFRKFLSLLKKARRSESNKLKYMYVTDAIDEMVWRDDKSFDSSFLKKINYIIGKDNYFMDALVTMPEDTEMIFPGKAPLYNVKNKHLKEDINIYEFDFNGPREIWSVFH